MAEEKKKSIDFDLFAAPDNSSRRRRVAATGPAMSGGPSGPAMSGGPSGPAMSGGPSGPAMSGGLQGKSSEPTKRRRRSADDEDMRALYG